MLNEDAKRLDAFVRSGEASLRQAAAAYNAAQGSQKRTQASDPARAATSPPRTEKNPQMRPGEGSTEAAAAVSVLCSPAMGLKRAEAEILVNKAIAGGCPDNAADLIRAALKFR